MPASAIEMPDSVHARNWVLVAGGFHRGGGMDSANAALVQYIADRGSRVHLVCHHADEDLQQHARVEIHRVQRPLRSFFLGQWLINARGKQIAAKIIAADPGARVVVNGANCAWPDVNWVHYVQAAWTSAEGAGVARLKNRIDKTVSRMREKSALGRAKIVIANSNRTRRDLIDLAGVAAERIHTVYLGGESHWKTAGPKARIAAREWLGASSERPLIAFVGALGTDSRKGFDTLWAAWQRLCSNPAWDANLIVAGGGRAFRGWQSRIAASNLADRVVMLGHTGRIAEVLAAADLLVSPVRYEPYGLNVHEALCCGIPAIVSGCAGVAERYPAEMAELLMPDPNDVVDLCARMMAWRRAVPMWKERVQPLARELRRRTWEEMAREIVQIAEQSAPFAEGSAAG